MTRRLDDQQQRFAAQVEHDHPGWVIMWGYHSRLYWAFPRFNAARGTVVAAPGPAELTEGMRRAELAAAQAPRFVPASPAPSGLSAPSAPSGLSAPSAPSGPSASPAPSARPHGPEPLPRPPEPARVPADAAAAGEKQPADGALREPEASVG